MRPVVIHISSDYPDPVSPEKTRAVQALVDGTRNNFRHVVYSLNRFNGWSGLRAQDFGEDRIAVSYKALPKGILWGWRLNALARWIARDLRQKNITPDLIEAHKFTVEGVIGLGLAREFAKPLVCDIQGDTDTNILRRKKSLRGTYRQIARRAAVVFAYSPWPLAQFREQAGLDPAKCRLLPVVPGTDALNPSPVCGEPRLLSVFNLDSWRRKNIESVLRAMKKLEARFPQLSLDIYGRGSPQATAALQRLIARSGVRAEWKGGVDNGALPAIITDYAAFVCPSRRETYGLVFAESLFAGVPVLFPRDRAIDGYLDTGQIGYAADPESIDDIADGIAHLLDNQAALKSSIAGLQKNGGLDILRGNAILETYRLGLSDALNDLAKPRSVL